MGCGNVSPAITAYNRRMLIWSFAYMIAALFAAIISIHDAIRADRAPVVADRYPACVADPLFRLGAGSLSGQKKPTNISA